MSKEFNAFEIAGWIGFPFIAACFSVKSKPLKYCFLICQFTIGIPLLFITALPFAIFTLVYAIYSMFDDIRSGRA